MKLILPAVLLLASGIAAYVGNRRLWPGWGYGMGPGRGMFFDPVAEAHMQDYGFDMGPHAGPFGFPMHGVYGMHGFGRYRYPIGPRMGCFGPGCGGFMGYPLLYNEAEGAKDENADVKDEDKVEVQNTKEDKFNKG